MPEPKLTLAEKPNAGKCDLLGGYMPDKELLLLEMLEALVRSWLETMTPIEIGADLERVKLLKAVRAGIGKGQPSPLVVDVYREVFLKDVWSSGGVDTGRTAQG